MWIKTNLNLYFWELQLWIVVEEGPLVETLWTAEVSFSSLFPENLFQAKLTDKNYWLTNFTNI